MKAEDFAVAIEASAPSREALKSVGVSDAGVERFMAESSLPRLESPGTAIELLGELGRLLALYDVSRLAIAVVEFLQSPFEGETCLVVGAFESDTLVADKETGVIRVEEHATDGHMSCGNAQRMGRHF